MSKLFTARLDNYLLDILDINDLESMAIASHEFINTDGAILEQTGRHPHEIKFRGFFNDLSTTKDNDYLPPTYANHFDFLNLMSNSDFDHTLYHPKYGKIEGFVRSMNIVTDDTQNFAVIDIEFVEKDLQQGSYLADQGSIDVILNQQQTNLLNKQLTANSKGINSLGFGQFLDKTINNTQNLVDQFNNAVGPARDFLKSCDQYTSQLSEIASIASEPFNTVTSAVNFANDVPSRLVGSVNSACNRYIGMLNAISNTPVIFINNLTNLANININTTTQTAFFQAKFLTVVAGSVAWQAGLLFAADEINRAAAARLEQTQSFDVKGNRVNSVIAPDVMSVNDIESILYTTRQLIQRAILVNREANEDTTDLANMAAALVTFVNSIKLTRRLIKTITVSNIPMHVLATQLGLDYNAADRVLKLNPQIKCPNFCEGELQVYVS
jgi:prophage DNA circulation protein